MSALPSDFFAARMRAERERQKVSQVKLAERVRQILGNNIDGTAILRIEQQTRTVRLDEAAAIAQALDVPLSSMIAADSTTEAEALRQRYLVELAAAHYEWEQARIKVDRISQLVQGLTRDSGPLPDQT